MTRSEPPRRMHRAARSDNPLANQREEGVGGGGNQALAQVERLTPRLYSEIERRLFTAPPDHNTTGIQAGYNLGIQQALKILREFTHGM